MNIQPQLAEQLDRHNHWPQFCKNILAVIDLSREANVDLDTAVALAEHYNADLWLLGFSSEPAVGTDTRSLCLYVWDSWARRAQVRLWDSVLKARERHYRTFPLLIAGRYSAEEIIRAAERLMADLIVVPTEERVRRSTGLEEDQTNWLIRKSPTPVFVAISPRHFTNQTNEQTSYK
jgi:nucleotide-binding universal stress UspA family protein